MPRLAINLASATDRFRGGTGTFVDGLLDGLARMGDAVDVVIVASPAAAGRDVWMRPAVAGRQEVVVEPAASSFGFASIGDASAIAALVRRLDIDVWFTPHTLPAPPVLPCATVGVIFDVQHEDLPELYAPRERARRALVYETIARTCNRVLTLSSFSLARIAARYAIDPARIDVVPLGPPAWTQAPREDPPPPAVPYVLYPATTWRHKNHVTLIDALARVRAAGVALDLILTGLEGEAHADVMARIAAHGLGAHVTWVGHVDATRLRSLYDGALTVAVPSLYEGFGLPVVEAMTRGVPAITADAASLPEVAGDAALRVPALDVGAWAVALARLAADPGLRERLRDAGHERAGRFSMDIAAERLWSSVVRAAAEGPRQVDSPHHVGPDRTFRACRYFLQAPTPATLDVRGSVKDGANWTITCAITRGEQTTRMSRAGRSAFDATWTIPVAPASVMLAIDAQAGGDLSQLSLLLADGTALDLLPSLDVGGPEETLDESLSRAVLRLEALAGRSPTRVALYGAGSHSRLLIARLANGPCRVVAVVDDAPATDHFDNLPLVPPSAWASLAADVLVLSSRTFEPLLAARATRWLPPGVPLVRLYTDEGRSS
ncbi:MAG: glycosyltransferase [Vicinamibacteria bacterium]